MPTWQAAALASSVSMAEERCAMNCPGCAAQTQAGFRRHRKQYKIHFCAAQGARPAYRVCNHCMQFVERTADAAAASLSGGDKLAGGAR